jgi:hypothetical protein
VRVSILIPSHNGARWLSGAIESALAQTWLEKEVLVVDDGSTDGTIELLRGFGDRIAWATQSHAGANAARNRLLAMASGEWVQYLDADDYLLPDKISAQVATLRAEPRADVVFGPVTIEYWSECGPRLETLAIPDADDPWVLLARWQLPQTGASLWRKQALLDVGGWNPAQPCCQEHELYLRLIAAGKRFCRTSETGAVYRQWSQATLSTRNTVEVRRRRLEILARAEAFLGGTGGLNAARRAAINQSRFEMARWAWPWDRQEARTIIRAIRASEPAFTPTGKAAPRRYRLAYHLFGFAAAEWLATWRRALSRLVGRRRRRLDRGGPECP